MEKYNHVNKKKLMATVTKAIFLIIIILQNIKQLHDVRRGFKFFL